MAKILVIRGCPTVPSRKERPTGQGVLSLCPVLGGMLLEHPPGQQQETPVPKGLLLALISSRAVLKRRTATPRCFTVLDSTHWLCIGRKDVGKWVKQISGAAT